MLTERTIQREAVRALRRMGYTVCVTSNMRRTANTIGTPDVFCNPAKRVWIGLEFKRPDGKLSEAQTALREAVFVCRSVQDAIEAVTFAEEEVV